MFDYFCFCIEIKLFQMLNLRHILTKVLMDVTNDMMLNVAKDVLKTTKLQTGNICDCYYYCH